MDFIQLYMKKIVVMGGGTGTYRVLSGLKHSPVDLTAIVSMSDSGGSTGRLRDEFGILPPGDLRNCLVALSRNPDNEWLFRHRYQSNSYSQFREISGHNLGNLILTAFFQHYGDFMNGLMAAHRYLDVHERNRVLPVTLENIQLRAVYSDGTEVFGETKIDKPDIDRYLPIKEASLIPESYICKESEDALQNADFIVIGPGDLWTSIIPNFLVKRFDNKKILNGTNGKKIFVCPLRTKYGETSGKSIDGGQLIYKASDFLKEVERHAGVCMDHIICNNQPTYNKDLEGRYLREQSYFVEPDLNDTRIILDDLVSEGEFYRHDPQKLARCLMNIFTNKGTKII